MQFRLPFVFVCTLVVLLSILVPVFAAVESNDKPHAVTTTDPNLSAEKLALMLQPLNKTDLIIEADGWEALVKEKATEIAMVEIEVRRQTSGIEKTEEIQEQAEEAKEELEQVKVKAEEAKMSGDTQALKDAEKSVKKAGEKVETLQQTVTDAVTDQAEEADKATEMYDRMSDETEQGLKETVDAADKANEAVKKVQDVIESAVDKGGDDVKKAAAEVVQASSEAQVATDEVTHKAKATAAEAAANKSRVLVTEQVMVDIREATEDEKLDLLEQVNRLREERTLLVDNLRVVVEELVAKTDRDDTKTLAVIKDYRLYIRGVSGINVDVTDFTSAWISISGWMISDEGGLRWAKNFTVFFGILIVAWLLSRILSGVMRRATSRMQLPELLSQFFTGTVRWVVMIIGTIMALMSLEVSIAPLLAVVGAAGFVIAFALQDSLSNVASGLMILFFRPFDIGDIVEAGGVSGKVTSLNLVSTTIRTFDNKEMIVPNNSIFSNVITNSTSVNKRRVDMEFGIGYDDDINQTLSILGDIVSNHPKILKDPAPTIRVNTLMDSSVNIICRPWTGSDDYWSVYWDITEAVKKRFDAEGVGIPYPQQDVHLYIQDTPVSQAMVKSRTYYQPVSTPQVQTKHEDGGLDQPDDD